jgi:hypothetical protein
MMMLVDAFKVCMYVCMYVCIHVCVCNVERVLVERHVLKTIYNIKSINVNKLVPTPCQRDLII